MTDVEFLTIGRIISPWGIKGDFKVQVLTDFPERFDRKQKVFLDGNALTVERSRPYKSGFIVKLSSIDSIDDVEKVRGKYMEVPLDQDVLEEGQYFHFQIIGLEVYTEEGLLLGKVKDISPAGGSDIYIVDGEAGEILIPAIKDVIKSIDLKSGRIIVKLIEGLL